MVDNVSQFLYSECYKSNIKGSNWNSNIQRDIQTIMTAVSSPIEDKDGISSQTVANCLGYCSRNLVCKGSKSKDILFRNNHDGIKMLFVEDRKKSECSEVSWVMHKKLCMSFAMMKVSHN